MFPGPDQQKHIHMEHCASYLDVIWAYHQVVREHFNSSSGILPTLLGADSFMSIPLCPLVKILAFVNLPGKKTLVKGMSSQDDGFPL